MLHPNANLDRIKLWADALLGDEFKQGANYLCFQGADGLLRHCCLGVACEVAIANGLEIKRDVLPEKDSFGRRHVVYAAEKFMLPAPVMDWYGLSGDDAIVLHRPDGRGGLRQTTGPQLNDELKVSFKGIARVLATTFDLQLDLPEVADDGE